MLKNFVFYTVASTVIAMIAQIAGASLGVVLFAALVGPPALLLVAAIMHYKGIC